MRDVKWVMSSEQYKSYIRHGFVIIMIFAATLSALGQHEIAKLSWLSGCWEMTNEKRGLLITEMWMKASGDAMMGVGRTLKAGKLVDYEFLRIVEGEKKLSYISRPSGNNEDTVFKMTRSSPNAVVFENPSHDFPQRIMYKRDGEKMTARIEGTTNGTTRGVDFAYNRVKCE